MADRRVLVARVAGRDFFCGVLGSGGPLQVHSVFDGVLNLTRPRPGARQVPQASPREFFSLAATGMGFAPYFLTLEATDSLRGLPVGPGEEVVVQAGRLLIGKDVEVDC
ncbi:MAG TPA: hypothetical protein GX513_07615, partial [Firmicutes bacterium]|nr:hypothetical protein [Bacillota bacterium]